MATSAVQSAPSREVARKQMPFKAKSSVSANTQPHSESPGSDASTPQKLEGVWQLTGKTERQDGEMGQLDMSGKEPICTFGNTKLWLSPPTSEDPLCGETRFSFEVQDAASGSLSDDTLGSDTYEDFEQSVDIDIDNYNQQMQSAGVVDICLKADGTLEGEALASECAQTEEMCFKFTGVRAL